MVTSPGSTCLNCEIVEFWGTEKNKKIFFIYIEFDNIHINIYKTRLVSVTMETDRKKYYVLNGSTYIALLSYFIKVYITYAMFPVYLLQKLLFNLKKCKNMLKIENRGCHGNGAVDQKHICIFVHHSIEVKNRQSFRKIYFFYFQPILTVTETDS